MVMIHSLGVDTPEIRPLARRDRVVGPRRGASGEKQNIELLCKAVIRSRESMTGTDRLHNICMAWCAIAMPPPRHRPTGPLTPPQPKRLGADSDHRRVEVQQHQVAFQPRLGPDMPPIGGRPPPARQMALPSIRAAPANRRNRLQPQRPRASTNGTRI